MPACLRQQPDFQSVSGFLCVLKLKKQSYEGSLHLTPLCMCYEHTRAQCLRCLLGAQRTLRANVLFSSSGSMPAHVPITEIRTVRVCLWQSVSLSSPFLQTYDTFSAKSALRGVIWKLIICWVLLSWWNMCGNIVCEMIRFYPMIILISRLEKEAQTSSSETKTNSCLNQVSTKPNKLSPG